ncbi:MAG: hypothetical protein Q9197_001783 [Variospora fuerteventurae]
MVGAAQSSKKKVQTAASKFTVDSLQTKVPQRSSTKSFSKPKEMKAPSAEDGTPSPKRQRTSRTSASGKEMSYDMKYHPMDDVLRPAASTARKAAHGISVVPRCTSVTSESTTIVNESDDTDNETYPPSPREHAASNAVQPPPCRPVPPRAGSPSSRRVTRAELNGEKPVMYSMKHHPADVVLRPAAARKALDDWVKESDRTLPATKRKDRRTSKEAKAEPPAKSFDSTALPSHFSSAEAAGTTSATSSSTISSSTATIYKTYPIDLKAGLTGDEMKLGWTSLSEADRLMYLLQKGAADGRMLPFSWFDAANALREHFGLGMFVDVIQAEGWVESLRDRYAKVSWYLQEYFDAERQPTMKRDQTVYYAEDLDVYEYELGDRYFRYHGEDVVQPADIHYVNTDEYLEGDAVQQLLAAVDENEEVEDEGEKTRRGLCGSYNDADGYIRQELGPRDDCSSEESAEREIIMGMRNSISADIDGVLDPDELSDILYSPAEMSIHGSEEIKPGKGDAALNEPRRQATPRRNRSRTDGTIFSVHEDQPGSTPKATKRVAQNFKSPGMDVPKENLRERSVSDDA